MNYAPGQIAQLHENFHVMRGTIAAPRRAQLNGEDEWFPLILADDNPEQALQPPALLQNQAKEEPYFVDRYPWVKLLLGTFLVAIFGIWSLIFMVMPRSDCVFWSGLLLGTGVNFLIKWCVGADLL
jgi:hypothetical protein